MYYNTVTTALKEVLEKLMRIPQLDSFRLVGGTSLSLQLGHRKSAGIDLFTDEKYSTINFQEIDAFLKSNFINVNGIDGILPGNGKSYSIELKEEIIQVDLFYSDEKFIQPVLLKNGIRMATTEEIIAMKLEVVSNRGRKKDFWDLHELSLEFSLHQMLSLHEERYPYSHDREAIKRNFINFDDADYFVDPVCLKGKHWELIKMDLVDFVK